MQHIIICDDDQMIGASLSSMIDQIYETPHQIKVLHSWDALQHEVWVAAPGQADIIFMDIQLGTSNGILVSRQLQEQYPRVRIIYITGYIQFSEAIFHGVPTAFLVKPIKPASLLFALKKATDELSAMAENVLSLRARNGTYCCIPLRQIRYIESAGRLVLVHTDGQIIESYRRLDGLETQLARDFVRCHQSYLVNLGHVRQIWEQRLCLFSGEVIPISRARLKATREKLMQYAGCSI